MKITIIESTRDTNTIVETWVLEYDNLATALNVIKKIDKQVSKNHVKFTYTIEE